MSSAVFTARSGAVLHLGRTGDGMPLLGLHGGYSSRGEIEAILDEVLPDSPGFERWTPDLPGMGQSIGTSVDDAAEVADLLCELVDDRFGGSRFVIVGHSLGGFLARAVAARMPERVAALALLCPLPAELQPEPAGVVRTDPGATDGLDERQRSEFEGYFVWHTAAMAARFRAAVAPSLDVYDDDIVDRIMQTADYEIGDAVDDIPILLLLGRRDGLLGYRSQLAQSRAWSRATVVVVEDAGHALPHEKPELVRALLADLLARGVDGAGTPPR
ncbi:alpha/beta hydrolase [Microbacterium sp. CFBP9034]|uniref:alpha/beta fold hydrolase n=1 Tax=Microbacterium sp. CFBP9034 TaxID=3096540 RepID=UPI002A69E813|nr:alpha/beta hydrolase [Microbacterium sp. CFBP9034]MDY0909118.1 alpha/beta hydrolase [Microbacterium sp. CFBP9034]